MRTYRLAGVVVTEEDRLWYDWSGQDCISAKGVSELLKEADGEDVTINLNSEGGSVFAGNEIYSMLKQYTGKVVVNINGLSASIASVLMLGADEINMSPSASIMIHKASGGAMGTTEDMQKAINALTSIEKTIISLYHKKTGLNKDKLAKMMLEETWFTAEEALELGFVDNIVDEPDYSQTADTSLVAQYKTRVSDAENFSSVIAELKNQLKEEKMENQTSLLEKIKNILGSEKLDDTIKNEAEDVEETAAETADGDVAEETAEDVKEEASEAVSEGDEAAETEGVEESADKAEDATNELVEALEKATNKLEEIQAENADLKDQLAKVIAERDEKAKVADKASTVVNRLNSLLEDTEAETVVMSNQKSEKETARGRFNFGGK